MQNQDHETEEPWFIQQIYQDLKRKYVKHAVEVECLWRMYNQDQRTRCVKAGVTDVMIVLKDRHDTSKERAQKLTPEWNLHDIVKQPEYLLNLLSHRATSSLEEQYRYGFNGEAGDHDFIVHSMCTNGLRPIGEWQIGFTIFRDGPRYGRSFKLLSDPPDEEMFRLALSTKMYIPQSVGDVVLERQAFLILSLSIIFNNILDQDPTTEYLIARARRIEIVSPSAQSGQSPVPPEKPSFQDLKLRIHDHKAYVEGYLHLLQVAPIFFAHAVHMSFWAQPGLIPDERGRRLLVHTDSHISATIFVVVHNAVQAAAIWRYLGRLFDLAETLSTDKAGRLIVLQEISNIYQLEYIRARSLFKRHVQRHAGSQWFHRLADRVDVNGDAMTTLKDNPEKLIRKNPQLFYMLRLCQAKTSMSQAVQWTEKLGSLHERHPTERDQLAEGEIDALCDLNAVIQFSLDTAKTLPLPPSSHTKGQRFVSQLQDLHNELHQLRTQVDLHDFAVPVENLLKPCMAHNALQALDGFVIDKVGASIEFLYDDLVSNCFTELQDQCQQVKHSGQLTNHSYIPHPALVASQSLEEKFASRKQKFKTRPAHSSSDQTVQQSTISESDQIIPPQKFKVQPATVAVFASVFDKSQARTSISWSDFQSAMADIGFAVVPKYGSVYTFLPPAHMNARQSLTLHRPHKSQFERHKILMFAQRLHRVYGWDEHTFEAI